jgi:hypothetical protein
MHRPITERRADPRYGVRLPLHYRIAQRGQPVISGAGLTLDVSTNGISFRCRKPLPLGVHIEVSVAWPALYRDMYPIDLLGTGFVVRSDRGRAAMRMTSHRLRVSSIPAEAVRASA